MSMPQLIHALGPVPQPITLTRKRSWNEMSHVRDIPMTPSFQASTLKRTKCTLASSLLCDACQCQAGCAMCSPSTTAFGGLSDEAQRFLDEDPFDFDALPHPVLMRQQAVQHCAFYAEPTSDDDMMGQELSLAAMKPAAPRWNSSVVGVSLAHVGRRQSGTFQPRRM